MGHCCRGADRAQLAELPLIDQIMPTRLTARKPRNSLVVALVYDGLCTFEFSCAAEVFGLPRPELGPDWYRFETCSQDRSVRSQYGMRMTAANGCTLPARLSSQDGKASTCRCRARYSMLCAALMRAERDCYPSVRVPSCWLPPACWMANGRPPTGATPRSCSGVTPGFKSTRMFSMSMKAAF